MMNMDVATGRWSVGDKLGSVGPGYDDMIRYDVCVKGASPSHVAAHVSARHRTDTQH